MFLKLNNEHTIGVKESTWVRCLNYQDTGNAKAPVKAKQWYIMTLVIIVERLSNQWRVGLSKHIIHRHSMNVPPAPTTPYDKYSKNSVRNSTQICLGQETYLQ